MLLDQSPHIPQRDGAPTRETWASPHPQTARKFSSSASGPQSALITKWPTPASANASMLSMQSAGRPQQQRVRVQLPRVVAEALSASYRRTSSLASSRVRPMLVGTCCTTTPAARGLAPIQRPSPRWLPSPRRSPEVSCRARVEAVGPAGCALQHPLGEPPVPHRARPDGQVRLLHGARLQRHVLHPVEGAAVRHPLLRQQPPHQLEPLVRDCAPVLSRPNALHAEVVVEHAVRTASPSTIRPPDSTSMDVAIFAIWYGVLKGQHRDARPTAASAPCAARRPPAG